MTQPTLVVWVLYDATTDVKYIKMNPANGSLAIFDTEEAAITAKRLNYGTDYKRCEYYSAPQTAPEVAKLVEDLSRAFPLLDEDGLDPYIHHCEWAIQQERKRLHEILYKFSKQGCPAHYANDYQPTPDVAKLVEALEGLLAIVSESFGVAGYHLNGEQAKWSEFEEVEMAEEALAIYRQQGGES